MKTWILAIGKLRGSESDWCAEYQKRFKGDLIIKDMAASKSLPPAETQRAEAALLLKSIPSDSLVVLLDEHGRSLSSRELATKIQQWQNQSVANLVFIIGGADGVTDEVKRRAAFTLSFGAATWPHRLVRVMLMEQMYRAQQINAGHPYHRD